MTSVRDDIVLAFRAAAEDKRAARVVSITAWPRGAWLVEVEAGSPDATARLIDIATSMLGDKGYRELPLAVLPAGLMTCEEHHGIMFFGIDSHAPLPHEMVVSLLRSLKRIYLATDLPEDASFISYHQTRLSLCSTPTSLVACWSDDAMPFERARLADLVRDELPDGVVLIDAAPAGRA